MSLLDRVKSLFSGGKETESELPKQPTEPNGNGREPTPEEIAAAAAATPAVAQVEPFSAEPEPTVQPAGGPDDEMAYELRESEPQSSPRDPAP